MSPAVGPLATRANLDRGARPRLRRRTRVALIVGMLVLCVGSCAGVAWFAFGEYLSLDARIVAGANGAISSVNIFGVSGAMAVQVTLGSGITLDDARGMLCKVVTAELDRSGVHPQQLLIYLSSGALVSWGNLPCPAPPGTGSGRYQRVADQIVADSGGAVSSVTIDEVGVAGAVTVWLAPGVSDQRAQTAVCVVVFRELYWAGLTNRVVSVWTSEGAYKGNSDRCKGPM